MQKLGLTLNLLGTVLFGFGVLDRSQATWADVAKVSGKASCIRRLAWLGLIIIIAGFVAQIYSINYLNSIGLFYAVVWYFSSVGKQAIKRSLTGRFTACNFTSHVF